MIISILRNITKLKSTNSYLLSKSIAKLKNNSFSFKNNKSGNVNLLYDLDIKIKDSEENIKNIINLYQINSYIPSRDKYYFIDFISNYNCIKIEEIEIISEIIAYLIRENEKITTDTYLISNLKEVDRKYDRQPKNIYLLYNYFEKLIEENHLNFSVKEFHKIYQSLNKKKCNNKKLEFILAKYLEIYINKIVEMKTPWEITQNSNEFQASQILSDLTKENNILILKDLSNLPNMKKFLNEKIILKNAFDRLNVDNQKTGKNNSYLLLFDEIFSINFNHDNIPTKDLFLLDEKISEFIFDEYFNKKNLTNINQLFHTICSAKLNKNAQKNFCIEIRLMPKLISQSSKILEHHIINMTSNQIFLNNFISLSNMFIFFTKFYTEIKHYQYTDSEELKGIFIKAHSVLFLFFSKIEKFQFNLSHEEDNIILILLKIFFNNSLKCIKSKNCDTFLLNNFGDMKLLKIFFKNNFILKKLIISFLNLDKDKENNERLKFLFKLYIESLNYVQQKNLNYYFLDLNMILYQSLLNKFDDEQTLIDLIKVIIKLSKFFSFNEKRYYNRMMLIKENLQLVNKGSIYKDLNIFTYFNEIEKIFTHNHTRSNDRNKSPELWWDQSYIIHNKFSREFVEKELGNDIQISPYFKNLLHSDFLIKKNGIETYVDLIGPFHLNNYESHNLINLNSRHLRKCEIFQKYSKRLIYLPYKLFEENIKNVYTFADIQAQRVEQGAGGTV